MRNWNEANAWSDARAAIKSGVPCLLWGPPGTGKTTAANMYELTKPALNITLTQGTPEAELRGHYMLSEDGSWKWHHGTIVRAMVQGRRIVLNEIQRTSDEAMSFMLAALDLADPNRPPLLALDLPNGQSVQPAEGFQVIATSNAHPDDMDPALRDRFAVAVEIPKPEPSAFKVLGDLQEAAEAHVLKTPNERSGSLRTWLSIMALEKAGVPRDVALRLTLGEASKALGDALKLTAKDPARS